MTIESLNFVQDAWSKSINALGSLAGNKTILDGMNLTGTTTITVGAGWLFYNKEVFQFRASVLSTTVKIYQKITTAPYNEDADDDGNPDQKSRFVTRTASCGAALTGETLIGSFPYEDLVRASNLRGSTVPVGMVMWWPNSLDTVPAGWVPCDGTNATPNYTDAFLKGTNAAKDNLGAAAGSATRTLITANLPAHSHTIPDHSHKVAKDYNNVNDGKLIDHKNDALATRGADLNSDPFDYELGRAVGVADSGNSSTVSGQVTGNGAGTATAFNIEPKHVVGLWVQFKGL